MKISTVRKKILTVSLLLAGAIASFVITNYVPKTVNASNMYTDFTAKKLTKAAQENDRLKEQAKEYQATHPNTDPVLLPMGEDPKQKIERIPPEMGWGIGWLVNGPLKVSELWITGDKPNYEHRSWNTSYAYSGSLKENPQQGIIGTFVMNGASDPSWSGNWKTPQLWGSVKITNITGEIVEFDTESGIKGTFNLTTHEWKTK